LNDVALRCIAVHTGLVAQTDSLASAVDMTVLHTMHAPDSDSDSDSDRELVSVGTRSHWLERCGGILVCCCVYKVENSRDSRYNADVKKVASAMILTTMKKRRMTLSIHCGVGDGWRCCGWY
jgi:hypothetical protein